MEKALREKRRAGRREDVTELCPVLGTANDVRDDVGTVLARGNGTGCAREDNECTLRPLAPSEVGKPLDSDKD